MFFQSPDNGPNNPNNPETPHLELTPMVSGALPKLNTGHLLLTWSILGEFWSPVQPWPCSCLVMKPVELDLNLWISFMAWFLSLWTCLVGIGSDPFPDFVPWPQNLSRHHYTAFWPEFFVGPDHHLWICLAHLSLAMWGWDLASKAPSWLLAHLPLRSSPALAASWQIYPGVWVLGALREQLPCNLEEESNATVLRGRKSPPAKHN